MIGDIWVCGYSPKHGYFRNKSKEPFRTVQLALEELKRRREDEYWRGVRNVILVEIWLESENRGSFRKIWECTMKQVNSPIRKKNEIGNFTYGY